MCSRAASAKNGAEPLHHSAPIVKERMTLYFLCTEIGCYGVPLLPLLALPPCRIDRRSAAAAAVPSIATTTLCLPGAKAMLRQSQTWRPMDRATDKHFPQLYGLG